MVKDPAARSQMLANFQKQSSGADKRKMAKQVPPQVRAPPAPRATQRAPPTHMHAGRLASLVCSTRSLGVRADHNETKLCALVRTAEILSSPTDRTNSITLDGVTCSAVWVRPTVLDLDLAYAWNTASGASHTTLPTLSGTLTEAASQFRPTVVPLAQNFISQARVSHAGFELEITPANMTNTGGWVYIANLNQTVSTTFSPGDIITNFEQYRANENAVRFAASSYGLRRFVHPVISNVARMALSAPGDLASGQQATPGSLYTPFGQYCIVFQNVVGVAVRMRFFQHLEGTPLASFAPLAVPAGSTVQEDITDQRSVSDAARPVDLPPAQPGMSNWQLLVGAITGGLSGFAMTAPRFSLRQGGRAQNLPHTTGFHGEL